MKNPAPAPEIRLRLAAGDAHLQHLAAGTLILLHSGSLRHDGAPRWLGEQMHVTRQRLDAGSCLCIGETGWNRLTAERDCALSVIAAAEEPGLLDLLLARLRRRRSLENQRLAEEVKNLRALLERRENRG